MNHKENTQQGSALFNKLIKGTTVPTLGFGTFELDSDSCRKAVQNALDIGYRHVDTARMYENEAAVGRGIADPALLEAGTYRN